MPSIDSTDYLSFGALFQIISLHRFIIKLIQCHHSVTVVVALVVSLDGFDNVTLSISKLTSLLS